MDSQNRDLTPDSGYRAYLAPSGLNGGCLVEVCRQRKFNDEAIKAFRQQFRTDPVIIFRVECQFHELIFKCAIFERVPDDAIDYSMDLSKGFASALPTN